MKACLISLLSVSVLVNFLLAGCCIMSENSLSNEIEKVASNCKIDTAGKSPKDLLKEIEQCKLSEKESKKDEGEPAGYYGAHLTEEDWKHIHFSLKSRPGTIETLEKYDKFIKEIKGKNLRIHPEEN